MLEHLNMASIVLPIQKERCKYCRELVLLPAPKKWFVHNLACPKQKEREVEQLKCKVCKIFTGNRREIQHHNCITMLAEALLQLRNEVIDLSESLKAESRATGMALNQAGL